jgi:hypothetical protein
MRSASSVISAENCCRSLVNRLKNGAMKLVGQIKRYAIPITARQLSSSSAEATHNSCGAVRFTTRDARWGENVRRNHAQRHNSKLEAFPPWWWQSQAVALRALARRGPQRIGSRLCRVWRAIESRRSPGVLAFSTQPCSSWSPMNVRFRRKRGVSARAWGFRF